MRDLAHLLAASGASDVAALVFVDGTSLSLRLDPRRAMGGSGRVDDASGLRDVLARLDAVDRTRLADLQLVSVPYGEGDAASVRARLGVLVGAFSDEALRDAARSCGDVFRFWDDDLHDAVLARPGGEALAAELAALLSPLELSDPAAGRYVSSFRRGGLAARAAEAGASDAPVRPSRGLLPGVNDLVTTDPLLAGEAYGWDPSIVRRGSNVRVPWRCDAGHVWTARVDKRALDGQGCRTCGSVAARFPDLAAEALGWDPSTVSYGSNRELSWRCDAGHVWKARVGQRTADRTGCPVCSGRVASPGATDLGTTHPDLAAEALGWDPSTVSYGSNRELSWRCDAGHVWTARVKSRTIDATGCPYCSGRLPVLGATDLGTTHPDLAAEALGWDPSTVSYGSAFEGRWRCPRDGRHVWSAAVKDRVQGTGCPRCSPGGFDSTAPGWLYLLEHPDRGLLKVGVSNVPRNRLRTHTAKGWEVREVEGPFSGGRCRELEVRCLEVLADGGAKFAHRLGGERFDGWTEAWLRSSFPVASLEDLLGEFRSGTYLR